MSRFCRAWAFGLGLVVVLVAAVTAALLRATGVGS